MASITQYNAQKCHAYFEGYGNKNGRSWTHVYLKTHLFTPEKLYFTKIKNKKKLRSGAILRSGGDAKQVFFFIWPKMYRVDVSRRIFRSEKHVTFYSPQNHCNCSTILLPDVIPVQHYPCIKTGIFH